MSWRPQLALSLLVGLALWAPVVTAEERGEDPPAFKQAVQLFEEGYRYQTGADGPPDLNRALILYHRALQEYPSGYPPLVPALYNTGHVHYVLKNYQQAKGYFIKAARGAQEIRDSDGREAVKAADEYEALARNGLGSCLQKEDKLMEAEQQFRSAILLNPQLSQAHYNLLNLLFKQKRWEEAEKALREARELAPSPEYEVFEGRQKGQQGREGTGAFGGFIGILIVLAALLGYYFYTSLKRRA